MYKLTSKQRPPQAIARLVTFLIHLSIHVYSHRYSCVMISSIGVQSASRSGSLTSSTFSTYNAQGCETGRIQYILSTRFGNSACIFIQSTGWRQRGASAGETIDFGTHLFVSNGFSPTHQARINVRAQAYS